ncbi:hypothetical protein [Marinilactibacillus psychrotolerans]|uniref:Uncharacterized protein n=1 Tax=Marinilactibacillus psychrotolerans TaxID=191770 RepID=A0AAV3WWA3_9LACT|nr:hypothetical protein [Marinilactibacillus psychrotolerans]GEL67227.1 hypothetical protein MPS01_13820 [Marinilactibacillus psychrotolerans]GEQ36031.1 hypothetical protein M132T_15390 [Marinilactibacillus psychrotolerans]SDC60556.1 hypothetical protein SAMN04488013_10743 [Marinilactibacillus psychrotolerans]
MRRELKFKEEWFATTEDEANKIVAEAREEYPEELIGHSINLKSNKAGEYYMVKMDFKYNTPAGIMESELYHEEVEELEEANDWNETEEDDDTEETTEDDE